ncbi:MAG TPA: hypothetical protein VIL74_08870 [Pyrinomonadaceae bacterium]|jgi:small-conductance mechanosensitive channel
MGLELAETAVAGNGKRTPAQKALRADLQEKVKDYALKGWVFDLDDKKKIYEAKLKISGDLGNQTTVTFDSNASVDNLLLRIDRYYEDLEKETETDLDADEIEDAEESEALEKPKKKLPKTAVAQCRVELSRDDLLKRADSLSKALDELRAAESRYKAEIKALTNERDRTMTAINERITKYNLAVSTKAEWRDIVCNLEWDFEKKIVSTIRPDTGEIVKQRPMHDDELQMELFD